MDNAKEARHFLIAVSRTFDVMTTFRYSNYSHTNQLLAQLAGLPRSTVARLTHTLLALGYLEQGDSTAKYKLGIAAQAFGATALRGFGLKQLALPHLQKIADVTGTSVCLTAREGLQMVFL